MTQRLAIEDEKAVCYDLATGSCEAWFHAFANVHIAVERRLPAWPESCTKLAAVPPQLQSAMDAVRTQKGCTWVTACRALSATVPDGDTFMLNNEAVSMTAYLGILRTLLQHGVNTVLLEHWLPAATSLSNVAFIMGVVNTYAQAENIGLRILPSAKAMQTMG